MIHKSHAEHVPTVSFKMSPNRTCLLSYSSLEDCGLNALQNIPLLSSVLPTASCWELDTYLSVSSVVNSL